MGLDQTVARALLDDFDVGDPAFIADPYPALGRLREATPLVHDERRDVWYLTRFDDLQAALRDRRLGRQYRHLYTDEEFGRPGPDSRWGAFHAHEEWSLLALEPPDHTRIRRLVSKVFTPRAVRSLEPLIEATSDRLLDDLRGRDGFDLIGEYAQPFSVEVICTMLGLPVADAKDLLGWSHAIVKMYELNSSDEAKLRANSAAGAFADYMRGIVAEKRRRPDGKLISQLVEVRDAGDTLTEHEILCTSMVLLEAGHEATVNGLANGVWALLKHPDEYRRLLTGEVEPAAAVEEMLRWDAPAQMFERWVLEPGVEIAGRHLEVGSTIAMLFGSAQRDPRRFQDADRFDIGRGGDTGHVGFGGGLHFCIGAPLARAELARSVRGIVERFPNLELAKPPRHHPTFVIRGLTSLDLVPGDTSAS